jgi:hypothetical protein
MKSEKKIVCNLMWGEEYIYLLILILILIIFFLLYLSQYIYTTKRGNSSLISKLWAILKGKVRGGI